MIRLLKAGATYFAMVFGVGFILGSLRVPILVPLLGSRVAELIEFPFMLATIFFAARWIVDRHALYERVSIALLTGIIAALLLLAVEFSVVLWLRGMTVSEFLAARDPVAAIVYYFAVAIFALMPALIALVFRSSRNE